MLILSMVVSGAIILAVVVIKKMKEKRTVDYGGLKCEYCEAQLMNSGLRIVKRFDRHLFTRNCLCGKTYYGSVKNYKIIATEGYDWK